MRRLVQVTATTILSARAVTMVYDVALDSRLHGASWSSDTTERLHRGTLCLPAPLQPTRVESSTRGTVEAVSGNLLPGVRGSRVP
jgi:hypothetical protein